MKRAFALLLICAAWPFLLRSAPGQGALYYWEWDEGLLHGYPDGTRILADFDGGDTTAVPDGFRGCAGAGWLTDWALAGNENVVRSAAVKEAVPLAGGGRYLLVNQRHSQNIVRGSRVARRYGAHDMLPASVGVRRDRHHSIQFLFRVDAPVSEMSLVRFMDDVTSRLSTSADTAWEILWRENRESEGFLFSNGTAGGYAASGVRLYDGDVYAVRIDLDPAASTYAGRVENLDYAAKGRTGGAASFTTAPLGLSGGKTETGGYLNLIAYMRAADAEHPERTGDFSIDRLRIVPGPDAIVPGELIVDPPTLENLGFRWYVEGDRNGNATVEVAYRRLGEPEWRDAMPLLRICHEIAARYQAEGQPPRHFRTANLFAGSVLFLAPDTAYEVRFTMQDPDGGAPTEPRLVTVSTRAEPQPAPDGRVLHVYPPDFAGPREGAPAFDDILSAWAVAVPGDILYLYPGLHPAPAAPYILDRGGEVGRPIVLRGAGADRTVIQGPDRATDLFRLPGARHLIFEDLTLRRAHTAISTGLASRNDRGGPGASWLTVRRCRIEDVINGIWTFSENSQNWLIADNVIVGIDEAWYPRPDVGYMDGSHTGVNVYGQGHVIGHNRIRRFSDSLAIANYHPPLTDIHRQSVNIDFHDNDLSFAVDDTIEADYGVHNIRVYRNLCYNAHTALSIQPGYGGPIYLIRNVTFGITSLSLKWNMGPSGPIAWHNTMLSGRMGFQAGFWGNGHLRNNLLLGGSRAMLRSGTYTPETTTMDYNGWYGHPSVALPIDWTHGQGARRSYASLAAFTADTGLEQHGMLVDADIFLDANPVEEGVTYAPGDFDLRLKHGSAPIDAGVRLPNVNDGFTGAAPDLGAYEYGRPRPRYGPRIERPGN